MAVPPPPGYEHHSVAVATALCDAITIVTVFFALQTRPLLVIVNSVLGLANDYGTKMNLGIVYN